MALKKIFFLILIVLFTNPAYAWVSGYNYRKPITITGSSAQTNYQMKLTVYKGTGTSELREYYNTGDDGAFSFYSTSWSSQTFTPTIAHTIKSVKLKLYKTGSSGTVGTVTVGIMATDGSGHPTGNDLCSGTINGDDLTTNTGGAWYEITLGDGYVLSANSKYAIVVRAPNSTGNMTGAWTSDGSSPTYAGGNFEYSTDSGSSWTSSTGGDFMFEERGVSGISLNNHCQDNFNDIRFTKSDGSTELDYWIESYTSGTSATVWVEFDSIPASPSTATFYIYYDNASASSGSNGDNTFLFHDDFPGSSINTTKWPTRGGNIAVSGGVLTLTKDASNPDNYVDTNPYFTAGANTEFYTKLKFSNTPLYSKSIGYSATNIDTNGGAVYWDKTTGVLQLTTYNTTEQNTTFTSNFVADTYKILKIRRNSTTNVQLYEDDTLQATNSTQVGTGSVRVGFYVWSSNQTITVDYVFVRNYVSPEPSFGTWGSEEQGGGQLAVINNAGLNNMGIGK